MKRVGIFTLIGSLLLVLLSPGLVQAQGGLTIAASSVDMEFPAKIHFSLSARSDADITDVRLYYTVERESFAQVTSEVYIEFVPATVVNADWTWDMKKTGGLPTGASVRYWWIVKDANGDKAETTPASIRFDDKRYTWRSVTENNVTMYWYKGNQPFAGELMSAAQQALTRLSKDTGAYLKAPVKIYIYANSQDLQGAMIFPQEWTGGSAFTEFGIITIGIDTNNLDWGKLALAHELTHLVVHQMTFNPYIDLPTWLDEGLAMYNEGVLGASFVGTLQRALSTNSLISVRSLASPFSANTNEALLAYAQSYSLIEFLVTNYGQSKMLGLLSAFKEGSSYDNALARVYDFDMDGLDTLWRNYVKKQYQQTGFSAPTSLPAGSLNCLYDRIISSASPV